MNIRSMLYRLASLLGDINAIGRGPSAVLKRLARKFLWKNLGQAINKVIR